MHGSCHKVMRSKLVWVMGELYIRQMNGTAGRSKLGTTKSELVRAREDSAVFKIWFRAVLRTTRSSAVVQER